MSKIQTMTDTVKEVVALAILFTVLGGVSFWFFEGTNPIDTLYWAIVSGTSTGYGDVTPKTVGGRITTLVYLILMIYVITPILTARIAAYMIVNNDAWTDTEQETLKNDIAYIKGKLG